MQNFAVTYKTMLLEDTMKVNGTTVLTYQIKYPVFRAPIYQMSLSLINQYYKRKALEFQNYVKEKLYPMAVEQYRESIKNGYPIMVYEAMTVFQLTYNQACIISLYFDQYEFTGGAHGSTLRYSDTWNLQTYRRLKLNDLFICPGYQQMIFRQIKAQIQKNPEIYFEDYEKLVVDTFNKNSFYCTPKGIIIYYQQYDIAPYSSGIREFLIPYSNCVRNPSEMCFRVPSITQKNQNPRYT